jgi:hypothetical protein
MKLAASIAALAVVLGSCPAAAQQAADKGPEFRNPTVVKQPDAAIVQEAAALAGDGAKCEAVFNVGVNGKPNNIKPNCTNPALDPIVTRAVESMEYLPEIYRYEVFEAEGIKQPFTFGRAPAAASAASPPTVKRAIDPKELTRIISRANAEGSCKVSMAVTAAGKPANVTTACTPDKFDKPIKAAVEKMEFAPAQKDGQAVDWPKYEMEMKLSDPDKK